MQARALTGLDAPDIAGPRWRCPRWRRPLGRAGWWREARRAGPERWPGCGAGSRSLHELLDRPLTPYYLILGITALLLSLGLVMVLSTGSIRDLTNGQSPYSDFFKQLVGVLVGIPVTWLAARCLAAGVPGGGLPAAGDLRHRARADPHPRGQPTRPTARRRWIRIGPMQFQPSELAKLALVLWGADLLARKEKLGLLADWRHMLVPLMPVTGLLAMLVIGRQRPGHYVHHRDHLPGAAVGRGRAGPGVHPHADPDGPGAGAADGDLAVPAGAAHELPEHPIPSQPVSDQQLSREQWQDRPRIRRPVRRRPRGRRRQVGLRAGGLERLHLRDRRRGARAWSGRSASPRCTARSPTPDCGWRGAPPTPSARLAASAITIWIVMQAVVNMGAVIGVLPITGIPLPASLRRTCRPCS